MPAVIRNINRSKQRDAIVNYLKTHKTHPTADTIYNDIKIDFPNISLGTVYRNLSLLVELGEIKKISYGAVSEHFDGDISPHNHFICNECGKIFDLKMDNLDFVDSLAGNNFDGRITGHNIYFYGLCKDCLSKEEDWSLLTAK